MPIAHVVDMGASLKVYDEGKRELGSMSKSSDEEVVAWGQDFFITKKSDSQIATYDVDCRQIASTSTSGLKNSKISVNNMGYIIVKNNDYNSVDSYTKNLQKLS